MTGLTTIQQVAVSILPILFGITVHEVAHGWAASKLGDNTAKMLGRLTLNPLKHIDPFGTIIVPILLYWMSHGAFIFGWARPVPVNFRNLKKLRRDSALVAAAGPLSNLLMAIIWALIGRLGVVLFNAGFFWAQAIFLMGMIGIVLNVWLMVLNLIPIPPLDGSHIVSSLLPPRAAMLYERIAPFGMFILLFLLISRALVYIIYPIVGFISYYIRMILGA